MATTIGRGNNSNNKKSQCVFFFFLHHFPFGVDVFPSTAYIPLFLCKGIEIFKKNQQRHRIIPQICLYIYILAHPCLFHMFGAQDILEWVLIPNLQISFVFFLACSNMCIRRLPFFYVLVHSDLILVLYSVC